MEDYLKIFIDREYPSFIDKYLNTSTLSRLKNVTQFCGCDYTKLYHPLFLYTRYDHSLVVAHMTWHFTHDKKETIAALLHDVGTPCFAHCIDYVFGDYLNQETFEASIADIVKKDKELVSYLIEDGICLEELEQLELYPILENKSPQLCTDRLDGVLHTCYIWLHTHSLKEIKEVYDHLVVLENEQGNKEIGLDDVVVAEKFVAMVFTYAKELQGNTDKYVMNYISEIVKLAVQKGLISLEDLYVKREEEIIRVFQEFFLSWNNFKNAECLVRTNQKPEGFYVSLDVKKRNVIPLIKVNQEVKRIVEVSSLAEEIYFELKNYHDTDFAYVRKIKICN